MTTNTVPIFAKVAIRRKFETEDSYDLTTDTYENCGLMITGNFMIVTIAEKDGSNKGKIYNLNDIYDYKTYNI
jgi:hypothetical protein